MNQICGDNCYCSECIKMYISCTQDENCGCDSCTQEYHNYLWQEYVEYERNKYNNY